MYIVPIRLVFAKWNWNLGLFIAIILYVFLLFTQLFATQSISRLKDENFWGRAHISSEWNQIYEKNGGKWDEPLITEYIATNIKAKIWIVFCSLLVSQLLLFNLFFIFHIPTFLFKNIYVGTYDDDDDDDDNDDNNKNVL